MARNPFVPADRVTDDEIEAAIAEFKENGGEVIKITESFNKVKKKGEHAVKLGKVHQQLRALKKKN